MRKRGKAFLLCVSFLILLTGCSIEENDAKKIKDLEFTVVDKDEIPEEMRADIEEKQKEVFKLSYTDKGYLYIARGYGKQETSGYSIEVSDFYETANAVYIHTNLIGPSKEEEVEKTATYPYIVIKTEYNEKNVDFE